MSAMRQSSRCVERSTTATTTAKVSCHSSKNSLPYSMEGDKCPWPNLSNRIENFTSRNHGWMIFERVGKCPKQEEDDRQVHKQLQECKAHKVARAQP